MFTPILKFVSITGQRYVPIIFSFLFITLYLWNTQILSHIPAHYKLDNLTVIIDHNGLQIDGSNDQVMSLGNIKDKFTAFGFEVVEVADGNDLKQISDAFDVPVAGKPKCILAHTLKGKGVSYMEGQVDWHGKGPNEEQRQIALKDLAEPEGADPEKISVLDNRTGAEGCA